MTNARVNPFVLTVNEFLERYQAGERNFAGMGLSRERSGRAIIEDVDLTGVNLSGADLWGVTFYNCILNHARMHGARLVNAIFHLVEMDGADLTCATLVGAQIRYSSWINVSLQYANLSFAVLDSVDLDSALLEECNLIRTNLSKISLQQNGQPYTLYFLRAERAVLWNTILPSGKNVLGRSTSTAVTKEETLAEAVIKKATRES